LAKAVPPDSSPHWYRRILTLFAPARGKPTPVILGATGAIGMRVVITSQDLSSGLFSRAARLLAKRWPGKLGGLMQSQNVLASVLGYRNFHDLKQVVKRASFDTYAVAPLHCRRDAVTTNLQTLHGLPAATARGIAEALPLHQFAQGEAEQSPSFYVFQDEMSYLYQDDSLRVALRELPGVPGVQYAVMNDGVFVFEKLVSLVRHNLEIPGVTLGVETLAMEALPQAIVSHKEAVRDWRVVPEPYEVGDDEGGKRIIHRPLNAFVPGVFDSDESVAEALALLLEGQLVPGVGGFEFRGQPLTLRASLDPVDLPPEPRLVTPNGMAPGDHIWSGGSDIRSATPVAGFKLVAPRVLADLKARWERWDRESRSAMAWVDSRASFFWAHLADHGVDVDIPEEAFPDYAQADLAELRLMYPELNRLTDWGLYSIFDSYQYDWWNARSWTPMREDDFLWYLMGVMAAPGAPGHEARPRGKWNALAMLQEMDEADITAFREGALAYDREIRSMARRMAEALRYASSVEDQVTSDGRKAGPKVLRWSELFESARSGDHSSLTKSQELNEGSAHSVGRGVTVMSDLARIGRKTNVRLEMIQQTPADLVALLSQKP
jgi:hypothetical protein